MVTSGKVIEVYNQASQKPINQFYKKHKQNVNACSSDLIVIARSTENAKSDNTLALHHIAGVALIRNLRAQQAPLYLFRSLFVAPAYRQKKLGWLITSYTEKLITTFPLYTLCEDNLIEFYRSLNFKICHQIPTELAKLSAKKNLTLMVRF
ncbi:hypothetical protein GCM10009128_00370 [Psychrosphaera haliotis]|uniref:GNAT family N-acetyltransferase n=1 Tax=Psychrosphaera haliotis TaxID=555083 RepID=UPI0031D0F857